MSDIHTRVLEEIDRSKAEQILSSVPAEHRDHVANTPFGLMVRNLAKPGEQILGTLTDERLNTVMAALGFSIGASETLDQIKKVCIYNKENPDVRMLAGGPYEVADLTPEHAHFIHMTVGVVGEAGELADAIVQHVSGAKPELDVENVREEVGDLLFYLQGIIGVLGISLDEVILANKAKLLGKRYKNGYSDKAAQERADKPAGE